MQQSFSQMALRICSHETNLKHINASPKPLSGLDEIEVDLVSQTIVVRGCVPPSSIVKLLQAIGKDAIIRGTGQPDSAAVCILESFDPQMMKQPVRGLARIVQVSQKNVLVDLSISGLPKGKYYPLIRCSGNLSQGALTTGLVFLSLPSIEVIQPISANKNPDAKSGSETEDLFAGQAFMRAEVGVKDLVGRAMVVSNEEKDVSISALCGVIARSAGAWENSKYVCSCSGQNVWQERQAAVDKGIPS